MSGLKFCGDAFIAGLGSMNAIGNIAGERFFIVTGKSALF